MAASVRLKRSAGEDEMSDAPACAATSPDAAPSACAHPTRPPRPRSEPLRVRVLGYAPAVNILARPVAIHETIKVEASSGLQLMSYLRGNVQDREVRIMTVTSGISNTQLLLQPFPDFEEKADIVLLCISADDTCFYRRGPAADVSGDPHERENYAWRRRFEAQIIRNLYCASRTLRSTPIVIVDCAPTVRHVAQAAKELMDLTTASSVLRLVASDVTSFWRDLFRVSSAARPAPSFSLSADAEMIVLGSLSNARASAMPMKPELMPLLERFLGDEVIDRQFKCMLLPPEALPERRAALCRADELYCAIDAPLIQHPNPDAVGRATLSKWRRKQPISQALFSRITSLYFNLSTPPSAKLSYTDLCACLLAYDGLDSTVFEYLLEYRMYAVTRHLLKQLGPEQSAKCVPLSSAPKAAVFLALRRREFPDGGAGIEATQAGGRADGWRLLALRSPDARPSMLMPFYTPPTLVQLAVNQLLLHPPAMPPYSPSFGGSPVANSPPPPVSSSFLATAAHSHGAPLSAPIALSSSSCSISSTASGSDSQDRLFGSLSHEAWCAALQPQAPYFCFLRFAPPDVLPRFLALIQSLHDAIPFSDLSAHPSGAPLYATLHYNHNVIQLVMPPDMRSLELYIGGTLVLDTSQANWFTPSPLATLIDGFAALGLVAEDIWPFLIVLLNWISYGASPHEVLFPASLFPPHAPGATLPRAEWWHHMLSVFAPLNFPAAICVERDGRDELGFNEDLEMSYLMDSSGPLEELSVC